MMDVLQSVAVVAANTGMPGSGVLVNSSFELLKICVEVAQVLSGMGESAASIATQRENIQEDVEEFAYVLGLLRLRVQNQHKLSEGLQSTILRFKSDVSEYDRIMSKFRSRTLLKQLVFRKEMDSASIRTKKTTELLKERLNLECSIAGSSHGVQSEPSASALTTMGKAEESRSPMTDNEPSELEVVGSLPPPRRASRPPLEELKVREKRYMAQVDSPEATTEMADIDSQKELLALLKHIDKRGGDPVVSVIKEKLRSSSSAAVKNEVSRLPPWHLTEDQVQVDETAASATLGFGGDAKIYAGVLSGKTPVAVKIFNAKAIRRSEKAKLKFIETMRLWQKLRHRGICRFYGACYLTKTPFVVMELCDLGPLDRYLRQNEDNRSAIALELLLQAAQAVLKMHVSGVVHGDLKCDNILVKSGVGGKANVAKVSDFDRSFDWNALKGKKAKGQRLEDMSAATLGVGITGATPWLAPECVQGKLPSPASDVYAFGMTLYQALTGKAPFYHVSSDEALRRSKLEHKLPAREAKLIKIEVWELIKRTSDPDAFKRPTIQEVMKALKVLVSKQQAKKPEMSQTNVISDEAEEGEVGGEVAVAPLPATSDGESPPADADATHAVEARIDASMEEEAPEQPPQEQAVDHASVMLSIDAPKTDAAGSKCLKKAAAGLFVVALGGLVAICFHVIYRQQR